MNFWAGLLFHCSIDWLNFWFDVIGGCSFSQFNVTEFRLFIICACLNKCKLVRDCEGERGRSTPAGEREVESAQESRAR